MARYEFARFEFNLDFFHNGITVGIRKRSNDLHFADPTSCARCFLIVG